MSKKINVRLGGHDYIGVEVRFQSYMDPAGGVAVVLEQDGERLTTASSNLAQSGSSPKPGCFFLKNYSENEGLLESLIKAGVVEETGLTAYSGWATFPEVRVVGEWADEMQREQESTRLRRIAMLKSIKKGS